MTTTREFNIKLFDPKCLPVYKTEHSAAMDCFARLDESVIIPPNKTVAIPLGFSFELPAGWQLDIRPRSGLAIKHQITLENSPGLGDADFIDEYKALVRNDGDEPFEITPYMAICQIQPRTYTRAILNIVEEITPKANKHLGFGSTGI